MWVSCNGFINLCFTGVFNNPAIGRVTIKTPKVKTPHNKAGRGHSGFPRPVWLGSPGDGRGAAAVRKVRKTVKRQPDGKITTAERW